MERVPADQLAGPLYVGATRARTHLVVIGSEGVLGGPALNPGFSRRKLTEKRRPHRRSPIQAGPRLGFALRLT